jgi:mitogen-activated protein kinase 1/3
MWSVGCIFAELLGMQRENIPDYKDRAPLFPGSNYGELSPSVGSDRNKVKKDQLTTIFSVIGTPTEEDLSFIDEKTASEIRKIQARPARVSFKYLIY